ncbi:MAG: hypothetical protein V4524_00050 [Patescibacteria group bacterium]
MSRTLIDKHERDGLTLTVSTSLQGVADEAVQAFIGTFLQTSLKGVFELNVTHKVTGKNIGYPATRIVGSDNILYWVKAKFQSTPDSCYEGKLFWKATPGSQQISAADIKDQLIKVAGIGWFNPLDPATRKAPQQYAPKGLLDVGEVVGPVVYNASDTKTSTGVNAITSETRGVSKNDDFNSLLFVELIQRSDAGVISAGKIGQVLAEYKFSKTGQKESGRGYGPLIGSWEKMGLLESLKAPGRPIHYRITAKAIQEYGLVLPEPKAMTIEEAAELGYDMLASRLDSDTLNGLLKQAKENEQLLFSARSEANALEEQRKELTKKIKVLKYAIKDATLNASHKLMQTVPSFQRR